MARRDAEPLIWENCTKLLESYVKCSFEQGNLPNPPLELPDFPAQYPKSVEILLSQTLGLFSIDKAGFKSKLSEIFDEIEPDYVKRHIDPVNEREKWAQKNIPLISKRILILQIRDWFASALDEAAPDTDRWFFAISTFIGMAYKSSDVIRDYGFNFLVFIIMAQSPFYVKKPTPSGPHHIAWNPSLDSESEDISPHPSGILAANTILDYLSLSPDSSKLIIPFWIENLTIYKNIVPLIDLFQRIKNSLDTSSNLQSESLIRATVSLISDHPLESKEILFNSIKKNDPIINRSIATSLPKLYSYDKLFTLRILDILLIDHDETSSVLATTALGFIIRTDINSFLPRATKVIENGNQKAILTLINSSLREYINYDVYDKLNLISKLWISSNENSKSKLVSFMLEIFVSSPKAFLQISQSISSENHKSFLEFHKWIGTRDTTAKEFLDSM